MSLRNTLFYLFSFFVVFSSAQKVKKEAPSKWVQPAQIPSTEETPKDGAYNYLLLDFQDNIIEQQEYAHYAIELLNSEGIQEYSDLSVSFDPTYQSLTFHSITIHRDDNEIDKLANSNINTFQRESNMERHLYDGSLTASINLTDIRVGDIIEYSFTLKGFNPINLGNYSSFYYQEYTTPVEKINVKVLTNTTKPIEYKLLNGAVEPKIDVVDDYKHYSWETNGRSFYQYDTNVPYWMDFQKKVSVSTFKNWGALNNLLIPLYQFDNNLKTPITVNENVSDKEQRILNLIRFVQDDIRYLGLESGIGAYKPHNPQKVLNQRYGDCKDKSLLLANFLHLEGVRANPLLVNTTNKGEFSNYLPGLNLFDHCIVHFEYEGKSYWVDPTTSNQGGNLQNLTSPDYEKGFVLKSGAKAPIELKKEPNYPSLKIEETITTDSIGGNAYFLIKSTYTASRADYMRDYFKSNSLESIKNDFINYYSSIYPSIEATQDIRFTDNQRNGTNEVIVEEYYNVSSFWKKDEETGIFACSTEPLVLESLIEYASTPSRSMPYYLGSPFNFEQITTISLPEYWNISESKFNEDGDSFSYENHIRPVGKTVSISHKYQLKKEVLAPEEVTSFIDKHKKINTRISYQLTHAGYEEDTTAGINWISILLSLLFVVIGVVASAKLYEKYNPTPQIEEKTKSIGGWLVLPAIGLVLTPLVLIVQIAANGYFDSGLWSSFKSSGYENWMGLNLLMGAEFAINIFLLIFTILLIILFFKKRTSIPNLMVIFYLINLFIPIYEYVVYSEFFSEALLTEVEDTESIKEIGKGILRAAIWVPYFLVSDRVKKTFVNQYRTETQNNDEPISNHNLYNGQA